MFLKSSADLTVLVAAGGVTWPTTLSAYGYTTPGPVASGSSTGGRNFGLLVGNLDGLGSEEKHSKPWHGNAVKTWSILLWYGVTKSLGRFSKGVINVLVSLLLADNSIRCNTGHSG